MRKYRSMVSQPTSWSHGHHACLPPLAPPQVPELGVPPPPPAYRQTASSTCLEGPHWKYYIGMAGGAGENGEDGSGGLVAGEAGCRASGQPGEECQQSCCSRRGACCYIRGSGLF